MTSELRRRLAKAIAAALGAALASKSVSSDDVLLVFDYDGVECRVLCEFLPVACELALYLDWGDRIDWLCLLTQKDLTERAPLSDLLEVRIGEGTGAERYDIPDEAYRFIRERKKP